MPGAARLNDIGSGHDCFPETPITEGSPDVIINGQPAARKGDTVLLHGCPCPNAPHGVHPRKIAEGSSTVIINGKNAARIGDGINCGGVIVSGSGNVIIGDTPHRSPVQECAKQAALTRAPLLALTPMLAVEPVFAKSCLRGAGCTDAGTEDEPQDNIGEMSFYVAEPVGDSSTLADKPGEVKQYAQAAKKKNTSSVVSPPQSFAGKNEPSPKTPLGAINKPQIPQMEPWYKTVFDLLVGKADAAMLPPPQQVVMAGTAAQAGATAAAGGAVAHANQDAAKALSHQMKRLSGPSIWQGQLQMAQSFLLMGALIQQHLKGEKDDLLTQEKLLEVAKKQGTVPSRVRYQWMEDEEAGRLKAVGYHTSMESGRDQVHVRLLKYDFPNNRYEFWEEGATGPTILWTPDNPGMELPTDTAHGEQPVIPSAVPGFEIPEMDDVSILATPMPDEKGFRDYILVFPENAFPPIYVYLSEDNSPYITKAGVLQNSDKATIDKNKLTGYALNPEHPAGGHKAKVFESALGYNQSNMDELIAQVRLRVGSSPAVLGNATNYGQQVIVDMPIEGINGGSAIVRTGWFFNNGSDVPRLVTIYVKGK
ncbi:S-type pyocin domain-containing protein [Pectobacterium brasiliense]|uniref:S-type pyocin domain-containing protein n=1 Tax=Pectobacterium brasiliense TaxID=180957 RepID=UPI0005836015|nr:S-type pyocin domain-containing protein [Pectobacterium brasiliense]KHT17931.1 S-type Pyocin domain-containing protein [Pectobacterium brasiliense]